MLFVQKDKLILRSRFNQSLIRSSKIIDRAGYCVKMLKAVVFLLIFNAVFGACPSQLPLYSGGQCRGFYTYRTLYMDGSALSYDISDCGSIQSYPITIHDDEQLSYWAAKKGGRKLIIGLTCNTSSKKWEWTDGSILDFKPPSGKYDTELDSDCKTSCSWLLEKDSSWHIDCSHSYLDTDIWCIKQLIQPTASDDCGNFDEDGTDGTCYEIATSAKTWNDAQSICHSFGAEVASVHSEQENSYIRRLAVSRGSTNGVLLGGKVAGKGNDFGWIDNSDWDYSNFYPSFPIDGLGECLTMDTLTTAGQWMNTDCASKLPVVCKRPFYNSPELAGCTGGPWKEGQIIYSPGFPDDASVPCDYFLTVPTGKLVKLEILLLEANGCCDHLLLTDGYTGGAIIANLTGDGLGGKYYYTSVSNTMRVSWQPNGGVGVRGLMMSFWTK